MGRASERRRGGGPAAGELARLGEELDVDLHVAAREVGGVVGRGVDDRGDDRVVFARGAVVTRTAAAATPLPETACEVFLPGITADLEPGSLRAAMPGRDVVAVRSFLELPKAPAVPQGETEVVRQLRRRLARLSAEEGARQLQLGLLRSVTPAAEKMLSTKTMLRMASVAGMMATTQVQAARKPKTSPKTYCRYGCTPPARAAC